MIIGLKMQPLQHSKGFSNIWPGGLLFDPTLTIFILVRDVIKTNILIKFYDYRTENVTSRVYKMFFLDLTLWPTFWADMNHFWTLSRFHQGKHSDNQRHTPHNGHSMITLAHSKHFVLRWANKRAMIALYHCTGWYVKIPSYQILQYLEIGFKHKTRKNN